MGFDLDMTLIDSRPGIRATLDAVADESGEDALRAPDLLVGVLRRNLDLELADRLPRDLAPVLADRFRELYVDVGVPGSFLLPGATAALDAVRAAGGRTVVVTGKFEPLARGCLRHVGLEVDAVHGFRIGPAKVEALVAERVGVYVGDTPQDMAAARDAGAIPVGVATGPHPAAELSAGGAEVVLRSLEEFAAEASARGWLRPS